MEKQRFTATFNVIQQEVPHFRKSFRFSSGGMNCWLFFILNKSRNVDFLSKIYYNYSIIFLSKGVKLWEENLPKM